MHFCRLRSAHPNPELTLSGTLILVDQTKFLRVIFDNKLTFLPHIRYLKEKCVKALNLLRVFAHTSCGADQHTLLHLYRSLVRYKLDCGSVVYGSARESYLRILDPIQNHALRLCLGAFRTSPASSMCVQTNEPPLYIRRRMLSIQCNVCNLRRIAAMGLYTLMLEQPISVLDIAPLTCSRRTYGSIDLTVVENSYTSLCT